MDDAKYISDAQQRLLAVILTLAGQEMAGLLPGQIAKQAECSPSQVTRDLSNLKHAGWAEEVPGQPGRWRLGPTIVSVAVRHTAGIDRARRRLDEITRRYGSEAAA
ncbi:MAG TPA: hypothetical protein PKE15_00070 [Ottowia sp.]|nr:hypothetical protein [Ottowia sp.]